jgi:osmotically-inducible protein OsmY
MISADYYSDSCQSRPGYGESNQMRPYRQGEQSRWMSSGNGSSDANDKMKNMNNMNGMDNMSNMHSNDTQLTEPHDTYRAGDLVTRPENSNAQQQENMQDTAATPQDKQINAQLRQRLKNLLSSNDFQAVIIKTQNGNVILVGTITKPEDIDKINEQLKSINGISKVDNQLKINQ